MANTYDVIVVGAGAAGLLAAARSAERGRRTLLLEKNRKPGVKILMSGGTRCNITHDCDAAGIIAAFGSAGPFLHSPLAALAPHELIELFNAEGVTTKVEPGGKVFPRSDRALDVLNALLGGCIEVGAELALGEPVIAIESVAVRDHNDDVEQLEKPPAEPGAAGGRSATFVVSTPERKLQCAKLIVTTGGKSYPGCGTTGDGYRWLTELGHSIRRPRPALVPLTSDEAWLRDLKGVTVSDVRLCVVGANQEENTKIEARSASKGRRRKPLLGRRGDRASNKAVLMERRGSLLFTHFGLSGPAVLDVSRAVTGDVKPIELAIIADFIPGETASEIEQQLRDAAANDGKRLVAGMVAETLPRRLVDALLLRSQIDAERRLAELSTGERTRLIEQLKRCEIRVTGSRGFEKAEVTAGGVSLDEVDSRTMESKLVPNLYLAGEILDLDGFIGGYNFQAAFSTGWLAGESV